MTGRVDLVWRIFEKTAKKVKIEVTGPNKVDFFSDELTKNEVFLFL